MLDIRTLLLMHALITVIACLTIAAIRLRQPPVRGLSWLSLHFACSSAGLMLLGLRGIIQDDLSVVGGNGAVLLALVLLLHGFRRFMGNGGLSRREWGLMLSLIAISGALLAYYFHVEPQFHIRTGLVHLLVGVFSGMAAAELLLGGNTPSHKATGLVCLGFGLLSIAHGLSSLLFLRDDVSYLESGIIPVLFIIFSLLFSTLLLIGLVMMVNEHLMQLLEKKTRTDALTGMENRHSLRSHEGHHMARLARSGEQLAVLIMDLDHFKRINDTYGHLAGDEALKHAAQAIGGVLRGTDRLFRYGGEEFVALLQPADPAAATATAERIRKRMEASPLEWQGTPIPITVSIGTANVYCEDQDMGQALERADRALYRAKSKGRNRVESSEKIAACPCEEPPMGHA